MPLPQTRSPSAAVSVRQLGLSYGDVAVLRGVDFDLPQGRTLALLGPSGCGKTTLLRLLAGLLMPTRGAVHIGGRLMADAATGAFVPPERRGLGMVFQDYALWPHMNVAGNVAFPLEMAGLGRVEIRRRVREALARVGLDHLAERGSGELSGGQQQRVAIARAIVAEPRLVLFDEPMSNLDRELRETLAGELAELLASLSLSAVYVTHDQSEAFTIADEVAVMQGGEIVQLADPQTLVEAPASAAVAEFLKLGTVVEAEHRDSGWIIAGTDIRIAPADRGPSLARARAMIGRKALRACGTADGTLSGRVVRSRFRGDHHLVCIALGDGADAITLETVSEHRCPPGEPIGLRIDPDRLHWFATA